MKRSKKLIYGIAAVALMLTLAACGTTASAQSIDPAAEATLVAAQNIAQPLAATQGSGPYGAGGQSRGQGLRLHDPSQTLPPAGEVDEQEIADLLWMREEEKLARDVYTTLGEQWGLPVFSNIARSEQTHMDAVLVLLDRYGVEDPVGDNPVGVFTDPELQALYDRLVAQGGESLADALKVGGAIEEIDILDLQERLANTDNADIRQVYQQLEAGSENHLRAFATTLQQQTGESYAPQYMDQAAFDAIMSGANGHGGHGGHGQGRGNGRGNGNGRGQGGGRFNNG